MKKATLIIILAVVVLLGGIVTSIVITQKNRAIDKKQLVLAQQDNCKANFDAMFKSIQQVAQVADASKEAFKEIYPQLIEGRYKNDNTSFMKWIQESNPTFDLKLYEKLAEVIEAKRKEFFEQQEMLIDVNRSYNVFLKTWPRHNFLPGVDLVNVNDTVHITLVLSQVTEDVYATGQENDIDLGLKKDTSK